MFLLDQAEPSAVALYDGANQQTFTYSGLAELVRTASQTFPQSGKQLIFHFGRNDLASLVWYLASIDSGHVVALLDEALAPGLKQHLISLYRPDWILYSNPETSFEAEVSADYVAVTTNVDGAYALQRRNPWEGDLHSDVALLLSTSGSTGSPKFVRLTKQNVLRNAASIAEALEISPADCAITSLPFYYSYGLSVINTHLLHGARLALTRESIVAPGFWNAFRSAECTSFAGVPYTYEMLSRRIKLSELDLPTLRTLTQAGGKLVDKLVSEFHSEMARRAGRFYVMYGQTEATARISILPWDRLPEKLGSAGQAIPGGSLRIDDGELVYKGPNVMLGYASCRADLAKGDELNGELRTGDAASLDDEGFVFISGRMKRDAKLFGIRVNLDEIEGLLREHTTAAAISKNEKLVIFCEGSGDLEAHRQHLAATLRVHPSAFLFRSIDRLPLNANGKIDYNSLGTLA